MPDRDAPNLPPPEAVLPHRRPILVLDRVLECGPDRIVAERRFAPGDPCFEGHFPGRPVVPGVILVEGLAQTLAYGVLQAGGGRQVLLAGIDACRFRRPVGPGDTAVFEVCPERTRLKVTTARGVVRVGGEEVARATLLGYLGEP